jgi:hypothetical protein
LDQKPILTYHELKFQNVKFKQTFHVLYGTKYSTRAEAIQTGPVLHITVTAHKIRLLQHELLLRERARIAILVQVRFGNKMMRRDLQLSVTILDQVIKIGLVELITVVLGVLVTLGLSITFCQAPVVGQVAFLDVPRHGLLGPLRILAFSSLAAISHSLYRSSEIIFFFSLAIFIFESLWFGFLNKNKTSTTS